MKKEDAQSFVKRVVEERSKRKKGDALQCIADGVEFLEGSENVDGVFPFCSFILSSV